MSPKNPEIAHMLNSWSSYYIHKPYYRVDEYFHPETRAFLTEVLRTHLSVETSAESIRQRMPHFNLAEAFRTCNYDGSGFISPHELRTLFENHGFFASHNEVSNLIDRFDHNKDGRISYDEFVDEVRPKSPVRR